MTKGDLRILGASDGYAHALVHLRMHIIAHIDGQYSPGIHPRHTRKLAAKAAKLEPLRRLEAWLVKQHADCKSAYSGVGEQGEGTKE